jgi:UDP-N-acetylmuramoyl-tripeptide--D-alanyl-D-alanine ligase
LPSAEKPVTLPRFPPLTCDYRWMEWTPASVARATGGRLVWPGRRGGDPPDSPAVTLSKVSIDSRLIRAGQLFVAIKAERDGHDFVSAAVDAGAAAVMVNHGKVAEGLRVPAVVVEDTGAALLALGSAARDRLAGDVVGITGSVGKTSTKDLVAAALGAARRVTASERSFNNELGVPLTLANAPPSTEVAVIEMGARGPGHITLLSRVARPTVGVVTCAAAAHTALFGTVDNIAAAKGELVESLPAGGTAVLNGDDARVAAMTKRTKAHSLLYSTIQPNADLFAGDIRLDDHLRATFHARTPWGTVSVVLGARGAHQVPNALAALAVACVCGVELESAAAALADARLSPWRMEVGRTQAGAFLINDSYNANPTSMRAALEALAAVPARRRVAVLGEMAELGDRSDEEHRSIADYAAHLGVEVIAVGTVAYGLPPATGIDDAELLLSDLSARDAVLVKASRVSGLEHLAARLAGDSSDKDPA